jgi:NAD(P)-dependent dehydrogenase (short-subunit alcohol dehydrogenase family)
MPRSDAGEIIVTGAGQGIGLAISRRLLHEGYRVSAWDIDRGDLGSISNERLSFYQLDVRDKPSQVRAAESAATRGNVVGLITCAVVSRLVAFLELGEALWDETFDINLKGSFFACQAVLPVMRRQRCGSIVLFSSMAARTGNVRGAHYDATKGGILGFARSLAAEVARDNIRVNVVSPSVTDTPRRRETLTDERHKKLQELIPLGRIGRPEDMVGATLFLLHDDSSFVTGQDLRINGGFRLF